jgi:integrase/recombinase XerC
MPEQKYSEQTAIQRNERIRHLLKELPVVCAEYFRSVMYTTSPLTRLAYAYDLRLFFQYLCLERAEFDSTSPELISDLHLNKITAKDIEGFQDYLTQYVKSSNDQDSKFVGYTQNHELGIMRKLCSIRALFEYLFRTNHIAANVATLVALPKIHEKPILYLEFEEMRKLLDIADTGDGLTKNQLYYQHITRIRDQAILLLFLGTGIRVSECVGINTDDIDFSLNAFIVTRKGGNTGILYFAQQVADALQLYYAQRKVIVPTAGHENAFFLSIQKKRITQRAVQNLVKKYALLAAPLKKKMSPHKLRSTFGTHLYQETGDIYLVADVLGHSDINTTRKHYAAMTDSRKREAAQRAVLPEKSVKNQAEQDES